MDYKKKWDEIDGRTFGIGEDNPEYVQFLERELEQRQEVVPHDTVVIRQNELIQKHPNLKPMLMEDPLARAWVESWSRTEMSIEDGLVELAVHLQKAKQGTFERLEDCIARNPGHSFRAV